MSVLRVSDVSVADVGNYTCRIGGPHNTFVASVTHQLSVRGTVYDLYPVYTMKLARRAGSTSARRALVVRSASARRARRALVEQLRECLQYYTIQMTR